MISPVLVRIFIYNGTQAEYQVMRTQQDYACCFFLFFSGFLPASPLLVPLLVFNYAGRKGTAYFHLTLLALPSILKRSYIGS